MAEHEPAAELSEERIDRIKAVFVRARACLGTAWVGDLFERVAPYDRYLQAAWLQLEPSVSSAYFRRVSRELDKRALGLVTDSGLPFSDHRAAVARIYTDSGAQRVSDLLALIEAVHPPSLLIATALRDALLGREVGSSPPRTGPDAAIEEVPPVPALPRLRPYGEEGEGLREAETGPRSYQPFYERPEYLEMARRELRHFLRSDAYRRGLAEIDVYATAAVRALPFPIRASGELARSLGYAPEAVSRLLETVTAQQSRLCELTLQFGALRFAWDGGNLDGA